MYQCPICNRWTVPCEISGVLSCQDCYDKRKKTINSTDKQKLVIHKMFAEPIDKVQVAMNEVVMAYDAIGSFHVSEVPNYLSALQVKISNLKAMLPVIQDEP